MANEEEKDVNQNTNSSTVEQKDVNTDLTNQQSDEPSNQENLTSQIIDEEVDEKGVSYKNRYHEMKRKLEETIETIPQIIDRRLNENISKQKTTVQEPQEFTVSDLERFAQQNPDQRAWVEEQKAVLIAKNAAKEVDRTYAEREKARIENERRASTMAKIQSEYPDLFLKDSSGRIMGWDEKNPVVRDIALLAQDEDLRKRPDGLLVAAELAHYRHLRNSQSHQQKEIKNLKAQKKELEKKTFIEGSSSKAVKTAEDPVRSALDRAKSTGSKRDIEAAAHAYFRKAHLGG